jgi:hypothetical protein
MFWCQEWALLGSPFLNTRFFEVPVNCLLGDVIRARNLKLLGSYLRIYRNRTSYKADISLSKEDGCPVAFGGDARNLMRGVRDDTPASL